METFSLHGTLTLTTGYTYTLTASDIISLRMEEGVQGGDMLLGGAVGAHGRLTLASPQGAWLPGGQKLGTRMLQGALAQLCLTDGNGDIPCGRFLVSRIESGEGEESVTLSGYDEMLHALGVKMSDTLSYPCTLGAICSHLLSQSGLPAAGVPACNAGVVIASRPDWGENCTLRQALGWVAAAMGCFARITPSGQLSLQSAWPQAAQTLDAGACYAMSLSGADFGLNRIIALCEGAQMQPLEAAINASLAQAPDNTMQISDNPLFATSAGQTLLQGVLTALSGMQITPFEGEMPPDTAYELGARVRIKDLRGTLHESCVFSRTLVLGQQSAVMLSCDPETSGLTLPRVLSGSGLLSGAALGNGVVTARHLAVGAVDAEAISARAITADKIALGTLTGESGVFGELSADLITAGKLSADRLIVGGSEFSIVRALNQLAQSLITQDNRIDGGVLADKTISAVKVTDDFGAGLELSSNEAVLMLAGKLDGTNSHLELTRQAINMVGGDINIATDSLSIRGIAAGDERMSLDHEGLSAPRVTVQDYFSAPNAVLKHLSGQASWMGGIQPTLDALPKCLTQDVVLTVPAGVYEEDVVIRGFWGAALTIRFASGVYLHGSVRVLHCGEVELCADTLGDACIYPLQEGTPVQAVSVQRLTLRNLYISGQRTREAGDEGSEYCVRATACNTLLDGCGLEYSDIACLLAEGGTACMRGCVGGCTGTNPQTNANLGYALLGMDGAHMTLEGTYPMGYLGMYNIRCLATYCVGSNTAATAGGMNDPASTRVTRAFLPSFQCSYSGSSRKYYPDNKVIWQGVYGAYTAGVNKFNVGTLWFGEASSLLAGKTIHQATLTLRRSNGGSSAARNVYLGTVKLRESAFDTTYRPEFVAPSGLPAYPAGQLKRESEGTFDVTSLMSDVQQGYGIGVYEPCASYSGSYSPHYTTFYGLGSSYVPVLTVTYS